MDGYSHCTAAPAVSRKKVCRDENEDMEASRSGDFVQEAGHSNNANSMMPQRGIGTRWPVRDEAEDEDTTTRTSPDVKISCRPETKQGLLEPDEDCSTLPMTSPSNCDYDFS